MLVKKFFILFILIVFSQMVFATCGTTLDKIERMDLSYNILPSGDADMTLVLVANYSKECLIQRFIENSDQNLEGFEIEITSSELECPYEFVQNYVDKELGNFSSPLVCTTTFVGDGTRIRMNFTGTAIKLAKQNEGKYSVSVGGGIFFANSPNDSSITINIPANATLTNHLPRSGEKTEARIYWYPAPKEIVQLEYTLPMGSSLEENNLQEMLPIIIGVFVGLIILVMLILARMLRPEPVQSKKIIPRDLNSEAEALKQKMKSLENSYMKGQMDETTYRRLMEQYQLQMNDLRVELRKQNK